MGFLPLLLNLEKKLCVVVGSGVVAKRKVKTLLKAGAEVKVISPEDECIKGVQHIRKSYEKGDLEGAFLVVAATDREDVNREIYHEACEKNIQINVVDNPKLCTFFFPSVISRGDLKIGISTCGKYPALSKRLRIELQKMFGPEYRTYLSFLEVARKKIVENFGKEERRKKIKDILGDGQILDLIKKNRKNDAKKRIQEIIFR